MKLLLFIATLAWVTALASATAALYHGYERVMLYYVYILDKEYAENAEHGLGIARMIAPECEATNIRDFVRWIDEDESINIPADADPSIDSVANALDKGGWNGEIIIDNVVSQARGGPDQTRIVSMWRHVSDRITALGGVDFIKNFEKPRLASARMSASRVVDYRQSVRYTRYLVPFLNQNGVDTSKAQIQKQIRPSVAIPDLDFSKIEWGNADQTALRQQFIAQDGGGHLGVINVHKEVDASLKAAVDGCN